MARKIISDDELMALCTAIESRYSELFGRAKGASYKKSKEEAWCELKADLLAQGFRVFDKPINDIRDNVYGYRKRVVETKWQTVRKTGSGGVNWKNWEQVIIRMEKFSAEAEIMEDVGDSGDQLTQWQQKVEADNFVEDQDFSPNSTAAAAGNSSGNVYSPRFQMRKRPKVENPSQFATPRGGGGANRRSFDELKYQLMEKELELKTKQLQMADIDLHYKRRSVELVELQISELERKLGRYRYALEGEDENTFTVLKPSDY